MSSSISTGALFTSLPKAFPAVAVLVAVCGVGACRSTPPPPAAPATVAADVWAVVNGRDIARDDVEKAYRRTGRGAEGVSADEELTAKLALLEDLIVQDLLIARARELNLEVAAGELDAAYAQARSNLPDEAFGKELARRQLTAEDLREGLRRELVSQKVIEREVSSNVVVSDQEVADFFTANRAQFNLAEDTYHLAQIIVTPERTAQLANRTGDDATTPQAAAAKAQKLLQRLKEGASFSELAMDYSEDPESAPRGGDLGLVPESRVRQASPPLRDAVLGRPAGTVNLVNAGGGVQTLVLVVAHEPAGQRDLTTPGVRENIMATIRARREQLLRAAYLIELRSQASVTNHLAKRLLDWGGRTPAFGPAAPSAR
jgi:peptidyl-prolyl cis-trans isomerase SurA